MKTIPTPFKFAGFLFLLMAPLLRSTSTFADLYRPDDLRALLERGTSAAAAGNSPVVVFDIDDTLTDSNVRKTVILREYASLPETIKMYPEDSTRLQSIGAGDIRWTVADTLKDFGIDNSALIKDAENYWLPRFFGDEYCAVDPEIAGAAKYVRTLVKRKVKIVYLTGRPQATMRDCTIAGLQSHGFPLGEAAALMMKPDPNQSDLDFKNGAFSQINHMGRVIGAFENEPANVNAYGTAFPTAMRFLLDTIHSPSPGRPDSNVIWIRNFL